jgi:hypothetical protein
MVSKSAMWIQAALQFRESYTEEKNVQKPANFPYNKLPETIFTLLG